MNIWTRRSIELANAPGYLDRLANVYPVTLAEPRAIAADARQRIRRAYANRNSSALVRELLALEKFPIKDPYIGFLRNHPDAIEQNPQTVQRIANTLFAIGFEKLMEGAEEPKEFNRRMGQLFKNWLLALSYPFLPEEAFSRHAHIAFLEGSDSQLRAYANRTLACGLEKKPDLLAKTRNTFIVGEAKFLTTYGGHQDRQLEDALGLISSRAGRAERIAVLDGVVWIQNSSSMYRAVTQQEGITLSALLLEEFRNSLR